MPLTLMRSSRRLRKRRTASTTGRGFSASAGSASFSGGQQAGEHLAGGDLPVAHRDEQVLEALPDTQVPGQPGHRRGVGGDLLEGKVEAAQLPLEVLAADLEGLLLLRGVEVVADLGLGAVGDGEAQPVAARLVPGGGEDLDDVAVLQLVAQGDHLPVHPGPDALVAHLGVDGVGEVDGGGAAREHLDLTRGGEAVHLLGVEVELEGVQELVGVLDLLLPLEELAQPGEGVVVLSHPGATLLVLPVGRDALLGDLVHLVGADLDLEGMAVVADDRGVERLVAVGAGHRDEVLDPPRDRPPGVVEDAEGCVAVGDRLDQDPEGHEVVDLLELDALALQLLLDRVEALDAPLDLGVDPGLGELLLDRAADLLDEGAGLLALLVDPAGELQVDVGLEVLKGQVLELVLDLRHPEPPGEGSVDVHGLAGDPHPAFFGRCFRVRMLWRRSASLTRMTRMSSTIARSILR